MAAWEGPTGQTAVLLDANNQPWTKPSLRALPTSSSRPTPGQRRGASTVSRALRPAASARGRCSGTGEEKAGIAGRPLTCCGAPTCSGTSRWPAPSPPPTRTWTTPSSSNRTATLAARPTRSWRRAQRSPLPSMPWICPNSKTKRRSTPSSPRPWCPTGTKGKCQASWPASSPTTPRTAR